MRDDWDLLVRIAVIGESQSSKSCFILRFVDNIFTPTSINSSRVVLTRNLDINGSKIKTQLWEEKPYYNKIQHVNAFLIMADLTENDDNLVKNLSSVISDIYRYASDSSVSHIVGTKLDEASGNEDNEKARLKKIISKIMGKAAGGIDFTVTSAKEGNNIDLAVERGVKQFLLQCNLISRAPSSSWFPWLKRSTSHQSQSPSKMSREALEKEVERLRSQESNNRCTIS